MHHVNFTAIPPPEPPLIELKSEPGFANVPIELTISAKNLSGSLEDIQIFLSGIKNGTTFSKGTIQNDSSVVLSSSEFGLINMTAKSFGEQVLKIYIIQVTNKMNFTRMAEMSVTVYPEVKNVSFMFEGCFTNDNAKEIVVSINSSVFVLTSDEKVDMENKSMPIPHVTSITLPSWARPLDSFQSDSVYRIEDTVTDYVVRINGHFEPFMITYDVKIEPDGVPSLVFTKSFEVSTFCNGGMLSTYASCNCMPDL